MASSQTHLVTTLDSMILSRGYTQFNGFAHDVPLQLIYLKT